MPRNSRTGETRLAWLLIAPALGSVVAIALFPLAWAIRESFHLHDLRSPWLGQPWIGWANYAEAVADGRLWLSLAHTVGFVAVSVALELALGLVLALALHRAVAARGPVRTLALIPWALPTVVAALLWRFLFDGPTDWLADPLRAWIPIVLADVWKTTPFVAIIFLAGLQAVPRELFDQARTDRANSWQIFFRISLPILRPIVIVALLFRTIDALRVFDLIYVLTHGGPGGSTASVSHYAYTHFVSGDFGYGSAISVVLFVTALVFSVIFPVSWELIIGGILSIWFLLSMNIGNLFTPSNRWP